MNRAAGEKKEKQYKQHGWERRWREQSEAREQKTEVESGDELIDWTIDRRTNERRPVAYNEMRREQRQRRQGRGEVWQTWTVGSGSVGC